MQYGQPDNGCRPLAGSTCASIVQQQQDVEQRGVFFCKCACVHVHVECACVVRLDVWCMFSSSPQQACASTCSSTCVARESVFMPVPAGEMLSTRVECMPHIRTLRETGRAGCLAANEVCGMRGVFRAASVLPRDSDVLQYLLAARMYGRQLSCDWFCAM